MLLSEIDNELSIRLGDPVPTPQTDGLVFSSDQRLKYLSRAYTKLSRSLKILMRDYQPEFNKIRALFTKTMVANLSSIVLPPLGKVDEVFVDVTITENGKPKKVSGLQCSYMEPSRYLSNSYGVNEVKKAEFADLKFKYTLMPSVGLEGTLLHLLPKADTSNYYNKIEVLYIPDYDQFNWDTLLPITREYLDILIDMAAVQGMQDIARGDKAQLIERAIDRELQILGQYGSYMKQVEGVKE